MAVNKDNIRLWAEALESGDYKQVKGVLHEINPDDGSHGYCCLGVACEVAIKAGVPIEVVQRTTADDYDPAIFYVYDGNEGVLPQSVIDWLGVDAPNPFLYEDPGDMGHMATTLNDSLSVTFTGIAKLIRSTFLND